MVTDIYQEALPWSLGVAQLAVSVIEEGTVWVASPIWLSEELRVAECSLSAHIAFVNREGRLLDRIQHLCSKSKHYEHMGFKTQTPETKSWMI
jgi:hypothetical protein